MIRRFYVTVNGRGYEVEVEEVAAFPRPVGPMPRALAEQPELRLAASGAAVEPPAPAAVQPAPTKPPAQGAPAAPKAVPMPPGGAVVTSPMPGKILSVKVTVGQVVKRGDVLMILEAMKMENEIQSPADGMVSAIAVEAGHAVEAGAALASIG